MIIVRSGIGVNLVWVKNVDSPWGTRHVGQVIFHIKSSIPRNQEGWIASVWFASGPKGMILVPIGRTTDRHDLKTMRKKHVTWWCMVNTVIVVGNSLLVLNFLGWTGRPENLLAKSPKIASWKARCLLLRVMFVEPSASFLQTFRLC